MTTATGSITAPMARSLNAVSNTVVNSTMPKASAVVYSHRLPSGGRSTATARDSTDNVSSASASHSTAREAVTAPLGTDTRTGMLIVPASVAACRYVVQPPTATSTDSPAATQVVMNPAKKA